MTGGGRGRTIWVVLACKSSKPVSEGGKNRRESFNKEL